MNEIGHFVHYFQILLPFSLKEVFMEGPTRFKVMQWLSHICLCTPSWFPDSHCWVPNIPIEEDVPELLMHHCFQGNSVITWLMMLYPPLSLKNIFIFTVLDTLSLKKYLYFYWIRYFACEFVLHFFWELTTHRFVEFFFIFIFIFTVF